MELNRSVGFGPMSSDTRIRQLERNYELLRAEILNVKRLAQEWKASTEHLEVLKDNELRTLQHEVEHLRIENTRLRTDIAEREDTPVGALLLGPGGNHERD
jgi:prefoldin subunit 5